MQYQINTVDSITYISFGGKSRTTLPSPHSLLLSYLILPTEYERVRELEKRGLFDFELVCPTPLPTPAVVVVDPFSSGSILAARVLRYKLRLVMVFSEVCD